MLHDIKNVITIRKLNQFKLGNGKKKLHQLATLLAMEYIGNCPDYAIQIKGFRWIEEDTVPISLGEQFDLHRRFRKLRGMDRVVGTCGFIDAKRKLGGMEMCNNI